jgi:hypothetical protein
MHTSSSCIDEWKSLVNDEFCLVSPTGMIHNLDQDSYLTDHQEYHYDEPSVETGESQEEEQMEDNSDEDDDAL